jgi:hypothetical protein
MCDRMAAPPGFMNMHRAYWLLVPFLLAGCGSSPGEPRELLQIVESRARWEAQALRNYDFSFTGGCGECLSIPLRIRVRSAAVVLAINTVNGDTIAPAAWVPTIDSLYAWILRDRASEACGRQVVQLDLLRHVPTRMTCSGVPRIADSGHWWNVTGFLPMTSGN